ncbi:type IV pilus assembly protein PilX [Pseudomonas sp. NFACC02]|nr:type IV pilus assembly protein PilX [Pseudomonas sp. NFACC02]
MCTFNGYPGGPKKQSGMALIVSLVFLLLLTFLGISSMQSANLQEKMAGSLAMRNQSFQAAEAVLRLGESSIQKSDFTLAACTYCLPPPESGKVKAAGIYSGTGQSSGLAWLAAGTGFYLIQNLGAKGTPVTTPLSCQAATSFTLYRVTAVASQGTSSTVLESIYAKCGS